MKPIRFHPDAEAEMLEAAAFYDWKMRVRASGPVT